jgi:hypothetical protein
MCSFYRCINYLLFIGCSYGGKCRKPGTVWEDKDTCTKYRCKQENVGTTCFQNNIRQVKNISVKTVPKSNSKVVEKGKIDTYTTNTRIHVRSFSHLGTGASNVVGLN